MVKLLKNIFRFIWSRLFIISLLLLVQLGIFIFIIFRIASFGLYVIVAFTLLSVVATISILNRDFNPAYKISWILTILLIPLAGVTFYLMFGRVSISKKIRKTMKRIQYPIYEYLKPEQIITMEDSNHNKIASYITNTTAMPVLQNTLTKYLSPGENKFNELIKRLKSAQKFIFLEYFIISEGQMWNEILAVLKEKVKFGVEVRVMYDDFGSINKVKYNFKRNLESMGIKVVNFNPFVPKFSTFLNYRDHRKIAIIDGNIAFTGGINIGDEYINRINRLGHWKDASIMIEGEGVWNLTVLFLELWSLSTQKQEDFEKYRPSLKCESDGYIQSFGDSAFDGHLQTENTYIQIINQAKKYVYITTPYLIIDNEMVTALKISAMSGVDVIIMTPHIPDKRLVFTLTRSYYQDLISAGVKIYEYLPGFLHSKSIVSDDSIAMIGTANLDYRSLYLHFEVSCVLYKSQTVIDIRNDHLDTIKKSKMVTLKELQKQSIFNKLIASILRAFSPLM